MDLFRVVMNDAGTLAKYPITVERKTTLTGHEVIYLRQYWRKSDPEPDVLTLDHNAVPALVAALQRMLLP